MRATSGARLRSALFRALAIWAGLTHTLGAFGTRSLSRVSLGITSQASDKDLWLPSSSKLKLLADGLEGCDDGQACQVARFRVIQAGLIYQSNGSFAEIAPDEDLVDIASRGRIGDDSYPCSIQTEA